MFYFFGVADFGFIISESFVEIVVVVKMIVFVKNLNVLNVVKDYLIQSIAKFVVDAMNVHLEEILRYHITFVGRVVLMLIMVVMVVMVVIVVMVVMVVMVTKIPIILMEQK